MSRQKQTNKIPLVKESAVTINYTQQNIKKKHTQTAYRFI
jgi:hypothetical protein